MPLGRVIVDIVGLASGVAWALGRAPLSAAAIQESERRRRILHLVRSNPGIGLTELRRRTETGWGVLAHHLKVLERAELVHRVKVERRVRIFPRGTAFGPSPEAVVALQVEAARKVSRAILARPGIGMSEVLRSIDESPRVVYHHVKRLLEKGLLASSSRTRHLDLRVTPLLAEALAAYAYEAPDGPGGAPEGGA